MTSRTALRVNEIITDQRAAIVRGDYPDPSAIERIAPLLKRLTQHELAPISDALRRNLELLAIAREAVVEMRAPAIMPVLQTYSPDGTMHTAGYTPAMLVKR
ncbi:hypothetical protein SAMN06273572_107106 [Monaibacterium marinum]|uniref:Uncharacterized protein n=1 Tax=Pontivivens marinum TaxID=1690039 RepID=A0A2C9CVD9_9RHOB|nr:hypothetical protein [Monaibacterium marinum]SOH95085.1 hypothetical protein SAMN06273572_107106 [Monaibacterium marinum]